MMLARKWDRLENQLKKEGDAKWDIIERAEADDREEGLIDDIRDLARYLILVESEIRARRINRVDTIKDEDGVEFDLLALEEEKSGKRLGNYERPPE